MKKRNALYCYLALTRTIRALLLQSPWDCLHLCVSSASDYWRHQPLCVVSECCWHELSPRTSDYRLPTPNNNNDTDTESCIHKSMSPPRCCCCCCCCCSARCVHCTCQLSLRFPLRLLVMDVPMPDHIQISTYVLDVCGEASIASLPIYLSVCLYDCLAVVSIALYLHYKSIDMRNVHSFICIDFFLLSPQLNTNYLHALAIWEFIEQIFRYERVSFMIMGRRQAAKCDDTEIQVQMYLYLSLCGFICVYVVTVS